MFDDDTGPPTLNRLNALMAVGYRIHESCSQEVCNAIWLDHPARNRVAEKTLIIYNDGLVVSDCGAYPDKEQLRFQAKQKDEFHEFLRSVPQPTFWEKTANIRYSIISLAILILVWIVGYVLFDAIFAVVRSLYQQIQA